MDLAMNAAASDLNLLMVHTDDHEPVLDEGLPEATARDQGPVDRTAAASHLWDEGGDPNDLEVQRWGVIAPQGPEGDRLLALIQPLLAHRQEQQGDKVRVYRVPAQMTHEEAMRWKKREFDSGSDLNIKVPRYQLILGDLDQVPLALQQVQASDGYVGRLAFSADEDYAAYVDKVLRWERRSTGQGQGRAMFFTVHDGTAATAVGHRALVGPGVEVVRRRQAAGQYPARDILEFGDPVTPSPDELLAQTAAFDPSVLFTLSHGEGAPRGGWRSPEAQRERQGAMSFGREGRLTGDDLRDRPFMPGGVWFMLACYGAGTPSASAYKHWLEALAAAGQFRGKVDSVLAGLPGPRDRPFIAALPKAVLANSDGPLAFMGHIDLAWTYSFQELDSGATNRPARYMAITRSILKRDRVGVSMRELLRYFDQTNIELTSLHDMEIQARSMKLPYQADRARQGHLWMLRQDLAAYVLLGDPAVRLPVGGGEADGAPAPTPTRESHVVTSTAAPVVLAAPAAVDFFNFPATSPVVAAAVSAPASAPKVAEHLGRPEPGPAPWRPASDAPPGLEALVLQWLLTELERAALAARAGLSRERLAALADRYRDEGRGALPGCDEGAGHGNG